MKKTLKNLTKTLIAVCSFSLMTFSLAFASHMDDESVAKRVAPIGNVCVEGEDCKAAEVEVVEAPKGPRSGSAIVGDYCAGCHASGVMNAPKTGTADWAKLAEKGIPALLKTAKKGKNAMPRKGGCGDCSDEELTAAIQSMIDG